MRSWTHPRISSLASRSPYHLRLFDSADQRIKPVELAAEGPTGVYACGITPYDSTHLGHAATYLAFDVINRVLIDGGAQVHYVQNVTDVDDPLFERAERDHVDWRELGDSQIELFRSDMAALRVIPPRDFVGAMEAIDEIEEMVDQLLSNGSAYVLDADGYRDIYASVDATSHFGYESRYSDEEKRAAFGERGGDPDRAGKHNPLDALIWRAERPGEPAWDSPWGRGRPGWHIECSAIATNRLGPHFAIQGGGSDLAFPHHEFSAAHAEAAYGIPRMAGHYVHTGMIALDGVKMSKSLGNLVFVHKLTAAGYEPDAIRIGVFSGHYREDRSWSDALLDDARERLARWRAAATTLGGTADDVVDELRRRLADDLDTPRALHVLDEWADDPRGGADVTAAADALLGIRL